MKRQANLVVLVISIVSCLVLGVRYFSHQSIFASNYTQSRTTRPIEYPKVTLIHEMLEFDSKDDFDRLVDQLAKTPEMADDLELDRFEQQFPSFRSMRARVELEEEAGLDDLADRFPDDVLNTVLNERGEVKIGQTIWRVYDNNRSVEVLNGNFEALRILGSGTARATDAGLFRYHNANPLQKKDPKQNDPNEPSPVTDDCEAKFAYKIEGYNQTTKKYRVRLINKSTVDDPPMLLAWSVLSELQEEPVTQSASLNPIVYLSAGEYDIVLQTFDLSSTDEKKQGGDCDSSSETVLLEDCEVDFTSEIGKDCTYTFKTESTGGKYKWQITDATTAVVVKGDGQSLVHKFAKDGTYTVTLEFENASKCTFEEGVGRECREDMHSQIPSLLYVWRENYYFQ